MKRRPPTGPQHRLICSGGCLIRPHRLLTTAAGTGGDGEPDSPAHGVREGFPMRDLIKAVSQTSGDDEEQTQTRIPVDEV
ncbi:hypothetical protein [Streptomyces vietnamensis]|uniref:hypothetical protein n=1 Tax=Streptomyces vietnamensis TaxID=362257 RepID=UPI000A53E17D|nr:hypothetical protein [Streptomyces vietnamensis]